MIEKLLQARYYHKNASGEFLEDYSGMCRRVAHAIAKAEATIESQIEYEQKFYDIMFNKYFLPNSPTLMNAGLLNGQLSACFVLDVEDNMESIMNELKKTALITKSGGGVGYNFKNVRPAGSRVGRRDGVSSGVVSFMGLFDHVVNVVEQGGNRRGAMMASLNVSHPEILKFISCKEKLDTLNNMNISVIINDDFMKKAEEGKIWELYFDNYVAEVSAKQLLKTISEKIWNTGEPGIVFMDRGKKDNITKKKLVSGNACNEILGINNSSCNLGSINLAKFYDETNEETDKFDYYKFEDIIRIAVRFLDNVITENVYPDPEIGSVAKRYRQIGLGVMGLADYFLMAGIKYGSPESLAVLERIMKVFSYYSHKSSESLGEEKGNFPAFGKSKLRGKQKYKRNAQVNCIAPTGSLALIADCNHSIEPIYSFKPQMREITEVGSIVVKQEKYQDYPEELKVSALDLIPKQHIDILAMCQKYIDNSISKTINCRQETTPEEIYEAIIYAWKEGCKGITFFREGCNRTALYKCEDGQCNL